MNYRPILHTSFIKCTANHALFHLLIQWLSSWCVHSLLQVNLVSHQAVWQHSWKGSPWNPTSCSPFCPILTSLWFWLRDYQLQPGAKAWRLGEGSGSIRGYGFKISVGERFIWNARVALKSRDIMILNSAHHTNFMPLENWCKAVRVLYTKVVSWYLLLT